MLSNQEKANLPREASIFALKAGMAADLAQSAPQQALQLWESHGAALGLGANPDMGMRILVGNALQRAQRERINPAK
ncbi:MAG: hypothetical protein ACK5UX_14395 [Burkholderiales bacterium]